MKFKARVKNLNIEIKNNTVMKAQFEILDKTTICNEVFYLGIDESKNTLIAISEQIECTISKKGMFDFISQHSRETFIVTTDKNKIVGVELIYG